MSTVWAVLKKKMGKDTGVWVQGSWDHLVLFSSLGDLVGQLESLKQKGQVRKLGIVAHGDQPGVVQLDRDLTASSALSFTSEFLALSRFITDYGRLIFFSCIAGGDKPGTQLLNTLSDKLLHNRYVIGFEKFGVIGKNTKNTAGVLQTGLHSDRQNIDLVVADQTGDKHLTEHSWFSKWSLNGRIIRLPEGDQAAPTRFSHTSYGVSSAREAIRRHLHEIEYIAIDEHSARSARLREVVDAFGALGRIPNKVKFLPRHELDLLARTHANQGVVVIWTQAIRLYKCANPACPGHSESWHLCTEYLKQFPNGPLVWP